MRYLTTAAVMGLALGAVIVAGVQTPCTAPMPIRASAQAGYPDVPNLTLTPGVARCSDLPCILSTEAQAEAGRPTQKIKDQVYIEYGLDPKAHQPCEVDHLISIEVGGADDMANYWPQHYSNTSGHPGAHIKDQYEDWLGRDIRSAHPKYTVPEAQQRLVHDWEAHYRQDMGPLPTDPGQQDAGQ